MIKKLTIFELLAIAKAGNEGTLPPDQQEQYRRWRQRMAAPSQGGDSQPLLPPTPAPQHPPAAVASAAKRRRSNKLTGFVILAGAVFGSAIGLAGYSLSMREGRRAEAAERREAAAQARAEEEESLRRGADVVVGLLAQAEVVGPYLMRTHGGKELLDRTRRHLGELAAVAERYPSRAGEAADLYRRCGKLAFNLGDRPAAARDYDAALRLAEAALGTEDNVDNPRRVAAILREWGVTRIADQFAFAPLPADVKQAWERAEAILRPLAESDLESKFVLAQLNLVRGNKALGKEKTQLYAAARGLLEDLLRTKPDEFRYRFTLAEILTNSANLDRVGVPREVRRADCELAVAILRRLAREKPELPEVKAYLAAALDHLGNALAESDPMSKAAEASYRESIKMYEALVLLFPGVPSNQSELRNVEGHLKRLLDRRPKG